MMKFFFLSFAIFSTLLVASESMQASAARAYNDMLINPQMGINVPVNNADFIFENLWIVWKISPVEKIKISTLSSDEKRKLIYKHYGLVENPYNKNLPMGFVYTAMKN